MNMLDAREAVKRKIVVVAKEDTRIIAVIDYGSTSEGRGDEWSDLDLALFIRDIDIDSFQSDWKEWAMQLGSLLVSFIGGVGKPWAVYDADPMPLRVDFSFHPESELEDILDWPNSPVSVEAMILYDDTNGRLTSLVSQLVGQSLAPRDLQAKFDQVSSDFWYYLLRTYTRLQRGEHWAARHDFNFMIVGNLLALLRIEAGAVERWRGSSASTAIERVIPSERLSRMEKCIPVRGEESLRQVMVDASLLGYEVCEAISVKYEWV